MGRDGARNPNPNPTPNQVMGAGLGQDVALITDGRFSGG